VNIYLLIGIAFVLITILACCLVAVNLYLSRQIRDLKNRVTHLEIAYRAMVENATDEQLERLEAFGEKRKNESKRPYIHWTWDHYEQGEK
jgi:hypothetical protein